MLKIISIVCFGFAAVLGILLVLLYLLNIKKKSLKTRKKIKNLRRLYGAAAGLFFIIGLALQLLNMQTPGIKEFISDESPVDLYTKLSSDAEKAYSTLPCEIFALGDDYYIRNGKGKIYGHLQIAQTQTDDQGNESEVISYQNGLIYRDALQVAGGEKLVAVLNEKGELNLTGAFEYLTYEKDNTTFEGKSYGKDCSFVDATDNSLLYVRDGDLWSAGYNAFGKLGDGTTRNRLNGVKVLEKVASVSTGETHTLAVDVYGNLYGFGDNSYSELGNRTTASSTSPEKLMAGVKQAEAGRYFSIVLTKNGEVYAAGRNDKGQLGTEDNRDYATYMKILDGVTKIAVCNNSCAALTASGTLYVWGDNSAHQLGAGESIINKPTKIADDVYDVAMGESSMGIILLNRNVRVTGSARLQTNNEFIQSVWEFGATVPEDKIYRETVVMPTKPE